MSLDNKNNDFEDDYLELLNTTRAEEDEPPKEPAREEKLDAYPLNKNTSNRSKSGDKGVYISNSRRRSGFEDVYSSSGMPEKQEETVVSPKRQKSEFHINDIPQRPQNRKASTPPVKPVRTEDTQDFEDISDFEEIHGKKTTAKKKKSSGGKIFLAIVSLLVVFCIVIGVAGFGTVNSVLNSFNDAEPVEHLADVSTLRSADDVTNIMFIGLDDAKGDTSRSDSMIIVSLNRTTNKVVMTSVLRDIHVDIPDYGEAKINASFSRGGAELLIQTIEQNFGIKIDGYASVDFSMFISLVDAIDGVEITLDEDEMEYMYDRCAKLYPDIPMEFVCDEPMTLNGIQALEYARMRMIDTDFERTGRQRKVIESIVNKVKDNLTPSGIFKVVKAAKEVAPLITTTFSSGELLSLGIDLAKCASAVGFDTDKLIVSQHIPYGDDHWWYFDAWDGSSIGIDFDYNKEILYSTVFDGEETPESVYHTDE